VIAVPIPSTDHFARLCKGSTCNDGRPTADSFEYRPGELSLSGYWLEFFSGLTTLPEKLQRLREFRAGDEKAIPGALSASKTWRFGVIPVQTLRATPVDLQGMLVKFDCVQDQRADNDSHALIPTTPERTEWPADHAENDAFKIAIQRWLAEQVVHVEGALAP
jgi:hypothetical protein